MSYHDVTFIVFVQCISLATPLLFAGLGEYVAERAGTLNISVEAMMLSGAYAGAYSHAARGGRLISTLSIRAFVCSPNTVPRSCTRLNST